MRRNSLDEAIKVCLVGGLQGIVSEVKAISRNPGAVKRMKESKVCCITYGQLNNVPEVVYMQHLMGFEGVIVDLVQEISEAVSDFTRAANNEGDEESLFGEREDARENTHLWFSAFCQYHVAHRNRTDGNDQLVVRVESSI